MRIQFLLYFAITLLLIFSQGCASLVSRQFVTEAERPPEYADFFNELDKTVKDADVRDAASFVVPGFPYLRANRFLASLKDRLTHERQKEQWVWLMQQLDLEARKKEIFNLPLNQLENLASRFDQHFDRYALFDRVMLYSNKLLIHDQRHPDFYTTLQSVIEIPNEYSTAARVIGLYPITAIPVAIVTHGVYDDMRYWHQLPQNALETLGKIRIYGPSHAIAYSQSRIHEILKRAQQNPLRIPIPPESDRQILLATFAPYFLQDVAGDYDEIGEVIWRHNQVTVNSMNPTVYYYFSHARFQGSPILQINYVVWYSARNGPNSPWIERGPMDGITVRISLDPEGHPFMIDIMNNCGCYHFFVPDKSRVERILPTPLAIDAFVPRWMPASFPQNRLSLRANSGWHQVDNIDTINRPKNFLPYQLVLYDHLEMLPQENTSYESIFNARGIVKKTGRIEPLIFFPMGVPDVGSMRQRGHHAIKLVGRAHFDDPDLFDDNFEFK